MGFHRSVGLGGGFGLSGGFGLGSGSLQDMSAVARTETFTFNRNV